MYTFFRTISDPVGLLGVGCLVLAFFLLNTDRLTPRSLTYQWLNCFGALFILYSLFFNWNLSAVVIEIIWIMISLIGIVKVMRSQ